MLLILHCVAFVTAVPSLDHRDLPSYGYGSTCRNPPVRKEMDEYRPQLSLHLPAKCVSIAVGSESEQSRYLNAVQCFLKKPAIPSKSVAPGVVPL